MQPASPSRRKLAAPAHLAYMRHTCYLLPLQYIHSNKTATDKWKDKRTREKKRKREVNESLRNCSGRVETHSSDQHLLYSCFRQQTASGKRSLRTSRLPQCTSAQHSTLLLHSTASGNGCIHAKCYTRAPSATTEKPSGSDIWPPTDLLLTIDQLWSLAWALTKTFPMVCKWECPSFLLSFLLSSFPPFIC